MLVRAALAMAATSSATATADLCLILARMVDSVNRMDIDPNQINSVAVSVLLALKHLPVESAVGMVKDAITDKVNDIVSAVNNKIHPAYEKALADTRQQHANCDGLIDSLRAYCQSDDFEQWQKSYNLSQPVPIQDFYSQFTSSEYGTSFAGDNTSQDIFRLFVLKLETHMRLADEQLAMQQTVSFEHEMRNQVAKLMDMSAKRAAISGVPLISAEDQNQKLDPLDKALDFARQLLTSGLVLAGQAILQHIKAAIAKDTAKSIAFSTYISLGNCSIMLDEYESARDEYKSALELDQENALANASLANAYIFLGQFPEALTHADKALNLTDLSLEPTPGKLSRYVAMSVYISALSVNGEHKKISDLVKEYKWIEESAACLLALGQDYLDQSQFDIAIAKFRKSHDLNQNDAQAPLLIAQSIHRKVKSEIVDSASLTQLSNAHLALMTEAEEWTTKAVNGFKAGNPVATLRSINNRITIRILLGKIKEALEDSVITLWLDPDNAMTKLFRGILLFLSNQPGEAEPLLRSAAQTLPEAHIVLGDLLIKAGKVEEGTALCEERLDLTVASLPVEMYVTALSGTFPLMTDPIARSQVRKRILEITHPLRSANKPELLWAEIDALTEEAGTTPDIWYSLSEHLYKLDPQHARNTLFFAQFVDKSSGPARNLKILEEFKYDVPNPDPNVIARKKYLEELFNSMLNNGENNQSNPQL